jgi:hypothetical protein
MSVADFRPPNLKVAAFQHYFIPSDKPPALPVQSFFDTVKKTEINPPAAERF